MKRILSLLVTFVVLLVLLSEIVYARSDAKELNGKVYVTDRIENYVCELDSAYKVAMIYKDNIIFYDPDSFSDSSEEEILKYLQSEELYPLYKYSIANDTCTEMSEKEKFDFYNEIYYSNVGRFSVSQIYEWEEDNKIYQVREINEYVLVYTVTEDTVVDSEKTYYFYDDEESEYVEIDLDNPPEGLTVEDYYETKYYVENYLPISEDTDYYTYSTDEAGNTAVKITDFDDISELTLGLLVDQEDLIKKTYILTADFDDFNKNPVEGITLAKNNLLMIIDIGGTNYLIMTKNEKYFIYTIEGEVINYNDTEFPLQFWAFWKFDDVNLLFTDDIEDEDNFVINLMDDKLGIVDLLTISIDEFVGLDMPSAMSYDNYRLIYIGDDGFLKITIYELKEGQNQTYNNNDLTFKFNGNLNKLDDVLINGEELNEDNYTATSGSTIITLSKDYLKTLASGLYTLTVEYTDGGYSRVTFTVGATNPQTYDGIMTYVIIGLVSLVSVSSILIYNKKRVLN